jgi:hypothetical protein
VVDQLKEVENKKIIGQQLRNKLKWKQDGDQGSKTFFNAYKERSTAAQITEIKRQPGPSA